MIGDTMIKGVDHVAVVVSDMDRSIKFYSEVLGLKIHHDGRKEGGKKKGYHFLDPDGLELEIYGKTGEIIPTY